MKTLVESLLDDVAIIAKVGDDEIRKKEIMQFISKNYHIDSIVKDYISIHNNIVDITGSVLVSNLNISSLTNGLFKFGKICGDFSCFNCKKLTTLKDGPEIVTRNYNCGGCINLKSLKGAPKIVGDEIDGFIKGFKKTPIGGFTCNACDSLTSLEGAPKIVKSGFECHNCKNLKSLKGAPREIGEEFDCSNCKNLESLDFAPEKIKGFFNCSYCTKLKSLKGAPKVIDRDFICDNCKNLISLEGGPKEVGGDFYCAQCSKLKSLSGLPVINGGLYCEECNLDMIKSEINNPIIRQKINGEICLE